MKLQETLCSAIQPFGLELTQEQLAQFELYYKLLTEWNEKINLTAITDPEGVAVKHFADSLSLFHYIDVPQHAKVIDVGTGAGFPGVVMKIFRPDIELTLLDSLKKRFLFLDDLLSQLGYSAKQIQGRAEEYGQSFGERETYDLCVSRAVAQLNTLSEYCLPFVRLSGNFIAFKGSNAETEVESAKRGIGILGGKVKAVHTFTLPYDGGSRSLVVTEKVKPTPDQYPRNNGKIKSKPL